MKWEYIKFEIQTFAISNSKIYVKSNRKIKSDLENKLKDLENDSNNYDKIQKCSKTKFELEEIYKKFL